MQDAAKSTKPEPQFLKNSEELLASREIDMALAEAQLRGQEAHVAALGSALSARGEWIDGQVAKLASWAARAVVDADDALHGLGGGAATQEADLERYVRRSETLMLGRVAMIATRSEVLERRAAQLKDREKELQAFEQAFVRAEVRLTARERLLRQAIAQLQSSASGAPSIDPAPAASDIAPQASHRHSPTVSMSPEENAIFEGSAGGESSPPVLDFGGAWPSPKAAGADLADAQAVPGGQLTLAGYALRRSAVEVDRSSRVVLASLDQKVKLSGRVDLVGKDARGEAHCFPVRVQLVMPGNDGNGSAVVLSAAQWSASDFAGFEDVLASLS
ncbi:MAG: hypothetical protein KC502_00830 [Myxococcales bacterium]|nr:hypothetical protein [Myxococcales bacterium]